MKLRVLMCLFLALIIISDITAVAAINHYTLNVNVRVVRGSGCCDYIPQTAHVWGYLNGIRIINSGLSVGDNNFNFIINHDINILFFNVRHGEGTGWTDWVTPFFRIYKGNELVASGSGSGTHNLNLPSLPVQINESHALNFTLAAAMTLPVMSVDLVDDIMITIGKYINCGLAKFTIRAALLKFAAKGVAVTVAIGAVSYLFVEFTDDIYHAIFATVPEINPGDTHFHETDIPQVMNVINTYFPTEPHIWHAIEQSIRLHIDAHGLISIAEVMTIIRQKQEEIVVDIYKETPGFFPPEIVANKDQVDEIMELIDGYFPVELPIRDLIEQAINEHIYRDEFGEIYIYEIIDIIEHEQNIFVPELPVETPAEQHEYIHNLIDKVIYEDPYIPTIQATPCIFPGLTATPTIPRPPKRPDEKIHTFPFYSLFVDPLASVIGITLAHLFAAMMIIGAIISIGATWGSIGAIFAGFIGTITTAYFGLTSWLIPVFLIILLIIYANIRIKSGVGKE